MKRLIKNAIKCKHCGDVVISKSVHDFEQCSCGSCFADGGLEYLRRGFITSPDDDYTELAEYDDVPGYHVEYLSKRFAVYEHHGYEADIPGSLDDVFRRFPQSEYYLKIEDENGNVILNTIDNYNEVN